MFIDSRYAAPSSNTLGRDRKLRPLRVTYPSSSSVSRQRLAVAAGIPASFAISLRFNAARSRVNVRMTASPLASPPIASRRWGAVSRRAGTDFVRAMQRSLFRYAKARKARVHRLTGPRSWPHDVSVSDGDFAMRKARGSGGRALAGENRPRLQGGVPRQVKI